jgi:ubiquinone/menaquinone biosynthesis C-methylase UbiE
MLSSVFVVEANMKANRDPDGAEFNHLIKTCELTGKNVLEIGCGEGKFTRQYVMMPKRLIGVDPVFADLCTAKNYKADENQLYFIQARGEKLPFGSQSIDIVIFASSL